MKTTEAMVLIHPWEDLGLGKAPFRFVAVITHPSPTMAEYNVEAYNRAVQEAHHQAKHFGVSLCSCNACGMSLLNNCVIRDAFGKHFVVGSDCVRKTGDSKLITAIEAKERAERRRKRIEAENKKWEERRAQHAAELQAQRERNDGLTDEEVSLKAQAEQRKARETAAREANAWLTDILSPLAKDKPGFVASIHYELSRGERLACNLPDRALDILADIYARQVSGKTARTAEHAAQKQAFDDRVQQMRKEQTCQT